MGVKNGRRERNDAEEGAEITLQFIASGRCRARRLSFDQSFITEIIVTNPPARIAGMA